LRVVVVDDKDDDDNDFNTKFMEIHNWFKILWIYFTANYDLFLVLLLLLEVEDDDYYDDYEDIDNDIILLSYCYLILLITVFAINKLFPLIFYLNLLF